jgi:tetratricopeptide (TPR) repeat protein
VHALGLVPLRTSGRALWRALCHSALLWLLVVAVTPASADAVQPTAEQTAAYEAMPEPARAKLLIQLARGANPDMAEYLLSTYPLTGPHAANRTIFIEGLILKSRGKYTAAAKKFRAALADDPKLTLVRAELAQTLYLLGDDDSAKHHLDLLLGVAPTAEQARDIESFIEAIDARRPFTLNGYVAVAPSTNINNGTKNNVIYIDGLPFAIDDKSKQKSGIGFAAGFNAGYTQRLDEMMTAVVAFGANTLLYEDSNYNQYLINQVAEMRFDTDSGYIGLGALASESFYGDLVSMETFPDLTGSISSFSVGPRVSLFHHFTRDLAFNGDVVLQRQEYADRSYQNAWNTTVDGRLSKIFATDLSGYVSGSIQYNKTADREDLDYWAYFGGVGVYKEFTWGITATADLELGRTLYVGDFPLMDDPRQDWQFDATISLWKRDWNIWGVAPVIEYSFTRNDSNIAFYEYTDNTIDFRLTKQF